MTVSLSYLSSLWESSTFLIISAVGSTVGSAHDGLRWDVGGQHNAWEGQWLERAKMTAYAAEAGSVILSRRMNGGGIDCFP